MACQTLIYQGFSNKRTMVGNKKTKIYYIFSTYYVKYLTIFGFSDYQKRQTANFWYHHFSVFYGLLFATIDMNTMDPVPYNCLLPHSRGRISHALRHPPESYRQNKSYSSICLCWRHLLNQSSRSGKLLHTGCIRYTCLHRSQG
jgi:uncharacterized membrane protein